MKLGYDVFICHAGEDKDSLAVPIYTYLRRRGMRVFLDQPELRVGGEAVREMEHAMQTARIGLFILSPEFAVKKWPVIELNCFLRRAGLRGEQHGSVRVGRPVLIPVFYRLTVAESRYRQVFQRYADIAEQHRFNDRVKSGEANMEEVLDALVSLTTRTGIESKEGVTNERTDEMRMRRERLVEMVCDEVSRVFADMTRQSAQNAESIAGTSPAGDAFRAAIYAPENAVEVLLDFDSAVKDKDRSREAEVLREVLWGDSKNRGTKIVVLKGGAGVGKSCILRGLAGREEVKRRFPGGVYYLSLGMDATVETLKSELLRMLRNSGGQQMASSLRDEKSLDEILKSVGAWMRGRKCLMLVDDLWERNKLGASIVPRVSQVFSNGSGSVLVLTTTFSSVALMGIVIEIMPREPLSKEARGILLGYARFSPGEVEDEGSKEVLNELLGMCGGLPVCLAVMGRGLAEMALLVKSRGVGVLEAYMVMRRGTTEQLVQTEVDGYKDLTTTLSTSLVVLEEHRGMQLQLSSMLSWWEMHRSLCVFKKQAAVPVRVLQRMWKLKSEGEALMIVKGFADVGLAEVSLGGEGGLAVLRLHDLIHEFAVACAKSKEEVSLWHRRLLEGYLCTGQEDGAVRAWWDVKDDGYVLGNISRHLASSGGAKELIGLLLNAKWTEVRHERGGLTSWREDFVHCLELVENGSVYGDGEQAELRSGLSLVRDAVVESWTFVEQNKRELGYQMYGRLGNAEEWPARRYLESVDMWHSRPWLKPMRRCLGRPGGGCVLGEFTLKDCVLDVALHADPFFAVAAVGKEVLLVDLQEMRVVRRYVGHTDDIRRVAISLDMGRVFSWSEDGTLRQWDVSSGEEVGCVRLKDVEEEDSDGGSPKDISIDGSDEGCPFADSTCIEEFGTRGKTLFVTFNMDAGNNERDFSGFAGFSMDSNILVTGPNRGVVKVCDVRTGESLAFRVFKEACRVAVSPKGRRFVASARDGTLQLWDVSTRMQVGHVLRGHLDFVQCVAFSADGQRVVSGSNDCTVRVWDAETGTQIGDPFFGHTSYVSCLAFTPDGRQIVSGSLDRTVRMWNLETGKQVGQALRGHSHSVSSVAVTPDCRYAVTSAVDGTLLVWDLEATSDVQEGRYGHTYEVSCLTGSPDGRFYVSGSADCTICIWDAATGSQIGEALSGHNTNVSCVAFCSDSRRFVSGSYDETLRIWDVDSRAQVGEPLCGHTGWVECVAYSPDGRFIVSGSCDKTVRIWRATNYGQISMPNCVHDFRSTGMKMMLPSRVGRLAASFTKFFGAGWSETFGKEVLEGHADSVERLAVSVDGKLIVSGLHDGTYYLWNAASGKRVAVMQMHHGVEILAVDRGALLGLGYDDQLGETVADTIIASIQFSGVFCHDRSVRLAEEDIELATLPAPVADNAWHYSAARRVLCAGLHDGRVLFFELSCNASSSSAMQGPT